MCEYPALGFWGVVGIGIGIGIGIELDHPEVRDQTSATLKLNPERGILEPLNLLIWNGKHSIPIPIPIPIQTNNPRTLI
jgi:hypothetical protein